MIALQTARHSVDYTFTAVKDLREADVVRAALDDPDDPARRAVGDERAARAIELSRRSSAGRPAVTWLKKVLHLGIGERWLVISLFAAAGLPVGALVTLLVLGTGSLLYTSAGRTLRARSWPPEPVTDREREIVLAQVDGGPLLPDGAQQAGRRPAGRAGAVPLGAAGAAPRRGVRRGARAHRPAARHRAGGRRLRPAAGRRVAPLRRPVPRAQRAAPAGARRPGCSASAGRAGCSWWRCCPWSAARWARGACGCSRRASACSTS